MKNFKERIKKASEALNNAEYILIGAGAGLSDAAGIKFSGKRFTDNFADFIDKYEMEDLYSSSFYSFESQEEKWAYWARHISLNRFEIPAAELYKKLYKLVQDKNYFVLTTNVEHQFWKAGFPDERIFATQGDYGFIQCAVGCHDKVYDDEVLVKEMLRQIRDCKIPSELVPKCPVCGGEMDVNLRKDEYFVQDDAWYMASNRYNTFIEEIRMQCSAAERPARMHGEQCSAAERPAQDKKVVFMELGVGFNTPGIIRYPFERMTYKNPSATLVRLNRDYPEGISENKFKTISFDEDMMEVICNL